MAEEKFIQQGRCRVIAEVAQAHDGSLGMAHAYIDAAARAGADAIKFQTHIAAAESCEDEPWRVKFSLQDDRRYDYWQRMEFAEEHWVGLKKHADDAGIAFLSSPFSVESVELLHRVGMPAWKIASGQITDTLMLEAVKRSAQETGAQVLFSTGMSPFAEIADVVSWARNSDLDVGLFQCTSSYPCTPEKIGLNVMQDLASRFSCPVGLSDHSGTIFPGLAAATLGASMLEVHVTFSREQFGPDVPASVTFEELAQLTAGIRFNEQMRANPVDKDAVANEMARMRGLFTKSIVTRDAIPAGTTLAIEHLTTKKPGIGIPATRLAEIVGRTTARAVPENTRLAMEDLA